MDTSVGVAELKRHFSEYLDEVVHRGERLVVRRRGKEVAALVPLGELPAKKAPRTKGLAAALGAWEDHSDVDELVRSIYAARRRSRDKRVATL